MSMDLEAIRQRVRETQNAMALALDEADMIYAGKKMTQSLVDVVLLCEEVARLTRELEEAYDDIKALKRSRCQCD